MTSETSAQHVIANLLILAFVPSVAHVDYFLMQVFVFTLPSLLIAGVTAKVIYSGGADLDILPQHASKGKGLEFLLNEVSLSKTTLV